MVEETYSKRESRLREENELMSTQSMQKLRLLEQERADMMTQQIRKQQVTNNKHPQQQNSLQQKSHRLEENLHYKPCRIIIKVFEIHVNTKICIMCCC